MGRTVLAVLAGLMVMVLCVAGIEALGHGLYPPPPGLDLNKPEDVKVLMAQLPAMAFVFVVLGWALGAFAGGWVASRISQAHKRGAALAIGVAMLLASGATLLMIPHPIWMVVLGIAMPIPLVLLAWRLNR